MFGISLPNGTIVSDVRAKISFISGAVGGGPNQFPITSAGFIAVEGYVIPVDDPDSGGTYNALWDRYVPKDTDVDTLDLDTTGLDVTSFMEPGEIAMANIMDIGLRPKRVYHHHRMLTAMNGGSVHTHQAIATPADSGRYTPGGSLNFQLTRPIRVSQPSVLVFAFGVPLMDDTTTSTAAQLLEAEWAQVKYMENTLERAILHQFGVFEAGAETPWEEATDLLQTHLEPDVTEEDAGNWVSEQYNVYSDVKIDHSVTGRLSVKMLSTGR